MSRLLLVLHQPIIRGALSGLGAAAVVDLHAFLTWKKLDDARRYDWGTALLRWLQGAATGALMGTGLGVIS